MGLLLGRGEVSGFIPLSNVHPAPRQAFRVDEAEVARYLPLRVVGLYHSHPDGCGELSCRDDAAGFDYYWVVDPLSGRIYESRRSWNSDCRERCGPE